jgi:four helix bundle protein
VNPPTVNSYRDPSVWQQAMALAADCCRVTKAFPQSEIYGMTAQIRRAATSIPANIAEGNGRETTGAYIQFLRISQGSLKELETLLLLANTVELLDGSACSRLIAGCDNVGKPLRALIRSLQRKEAMGVGGTEDR